MRIQKRAGIVLGGLLLIGCLWSAYNYLYEVPVLMYHHVDDNPELSSVYVTPQVFERQMEFLRVHRYDVLSLEEYINRLRHGGRLSKRSVVITFDDGYEDNIRVAFPILKKMGFSATIFMITENIGQHEWLTAEDLKILSETGITIGSHTTAHAFLPSIRDPKILYEELTQSKKELEEILKRPVNTFSYPAGGADARSRAFVEKAGYLGAVTTNYKAERRGDPYMIRRIKITDSNGSLFSFWLKVSGLYQLGKKSVVAKKAENY